MKRAMEVVEYLGPRLLTLPHSINKENGGKKFGESEPFKLDVRNANLESLINDEKYSSLKEKCW